MAGRVVIAGAMGLVGRAALDRYVANGWEVIGLSRRMPAEETGARFIPLDLTDAAACRRAISGLGASHLVYSALYEKPELRAGWLDTEQMETNRLMLANCVNALDGEDGALRHITLLQGTKAYGVHLGQMPIPGKEDARRHIHPNFYWLQEDYLREHQQGRGWHWTVLRPQAVIGFATGSAMNLLAAIGAYAAISREMGLPLVFPGKGDRVTEVTDARLLAAAIAWAGGAPAAQDQIFNVTNGDVLTWRSLFPVVARVFGMEMGADHPMPMVAIMADKEPVWQGIVRRYGLKPSTLRDLVGVSWQFADFAFSRDDQAASLVSTIKIRQAGFGECIDTAAMLDWWLTELQRQGILPP
ncbi:NAD-dependent epimerase/dehydratase family protein [Roseomonas chloroacetimidivorans]|jgi:nucleoside-diphosphate-sugar epimerase|uniref:NAD-dependent epimerase/dehydratase family protein n=1 Tax=Roseomonas chloroacetimidivorans TaxID=1766656 RepID=UPI003C75C82A